MASGKNCFSLVIFDLDGTLIDAFEDIALAANFVRSRNKMTELTVADVKQHVGHGARYLVEGVLQTREVSIVDENLQALVAFYEGLEESRAKVYEGVIETLQALKSNLVRTAVASNKPHTVAVQVVNKLGLAPFLDFVRGETAEIKRKPAPDALLQTMKDAGVPPERTLMVGDTEIDIQAARAAGVRVAAVTYGQHGSEQLARAMPDFMIHSMRELLNVIS